MATKKTTTTTKSAAKEPTSRKTVRRTETKAPKVASAQTATDTTTAKPAWAPSYDDIARRAYELFEARGFSHGNDVEDWLAAERDLQGSL